MTPHMRSLIKESYENSTSLELFYEDGKISVGTEISSAYKDSVIDTPHMTLDLSHIRDDDLTEEYTIYDLAQSHIDKWLDELECN